MSLALPNEIDITVLLAGGKIAGIEIQPRARPPLARLFAGKPATSLLNVLPKLFSLCATAHQVAFLSAVAAARRGDVSLATRRHRIILVVIERLTELLRGLFFGHLAGDIASAGAIRAAVQGASVLIGIAESGCDQVRCEAMARMRPALAALGIADEDGAPTPGSPLALRLATLDKDVLKPNAAEHSFLSVADDHKVTERLLADDAGFSNAPELDGRIPETGVWARRVVRDQLPPSRSSAAERLKARTAEVARLSAWLQASATAETAEVGILESYTLAACRGAAAVECARGRLYHAVELDREGEISRFEFLAPTEWNFHARGPVIRSLLGAALTSREGQDAVRAIVGSFDPCVGFRLNFREVADARNGAL
ncbi:nickel-dependent hydrogenase large subunit [Bradyrhizobium sp. CB3481]|uniref:nickel-dependent hydrogenase large subunit n=1 Tax=Bradyrhizobium sp. CB3481 TaxID=3039158 RepID=UPI0024B182EB|nr:nickel-dependent hydrogenase large subunit [Bradyrhizobium sp. CB3481]WFU14809.1 nickel-dependent hydrogenase large subunit [Bradyrhizobium sp. CB3481]